MTTWPPVVLLKLQETILTHHAQQEEPLELVQVTRAAWQIRILGLLLAVPTFPTQGILASMENHQGLLAACYISKHFSSWGEVVLKL